MQAVVAGLEEAFDKAREQCPDRCVEVYFRFAGMPVRFRAIGRELAGHVSRALSHLEAEAPGDGRFELDIALWDARDTGVPPPCGPLAEVPDENEEVARSPDDALIVQSRSQSVIALDRRRRRIVGCAAYGDRGPLLHELGKPLQQLLGVWYLDHDVPLIHAGLVARDGKGVLVGGTGGAGKSTTTVACLLGGFDYLGDDRVGLCGVGGCFVGHSVFNSAMFFEEHLARFSALWPHVVAPRHACDRKPVVFLSEAFAERVAASAAIAAVVVPRFVAGRRGSRVHPASAAATLLSIAPSSVVFPLGPGRAGLSGVANLLRTVPSFSLETGEDITMIPACLDRILDRVAAS